MPILSLCLLSGFGVLALEVLWTRLFSQVLENSVYTFAALLVVVLVCLALGAMLSALIARSGAPPLLVLNLFIGIVVDAMQRQHAADEEAVLDSNFEEGHRERNEIMDELRSLREEITNLSEQVGRQDPA